MSKPPSDVPVAALNEVVAKVEAARAASPFQQPVRLLAVSKEVPVERVAELWRAGQRDFAENYVQELVDKCEALNALGCDTASWHFIGNLQSNKVKALIPHVASIHSIDSEKIAKEVAKRWKSHSWGEKLPVFIQVNIDRETSKSGVTPEEAPALAALIAKDMPELKLEGLMCVPAPGPIEASHAAFKHLRELELKCRPHTAGQLSMGMSADYEAAIAEGATHVRLGSALFGQRSGPPFGI